MKEKLHKEHINRVSKSKISEKAKLPMIEILKKYKYKVKIPNRKNLMMLTQILTGTSILNYSLSLIHISEPTRPERMGGGGLGV